MAGATILLSINVFVIYLIISVKFVDFLWFVKIFTRHPVETYFAHVKDYCPIAYLSDYHAMYEAYESIYIQFHINSQIITSHENFLSVNNNTIVRGYYARRLYKKFMNMARRHSESLLKQMLNKNNIVYTDIDQDTMTVNFQQYVFRNIVYVDYGSFISPTISYAQYLGSEKNSRARIYLFSKDRTRLIKHLKRNETKKIFELFETGKYNDCQTKNN